MVFGYYIGSWTSRIFFGVVFSLLWPESDIQKCMRATVSYHRDAVTKLADRHTHFCHLKNSQIDHVEVFCFLEVEDFFLHEEFLSLVPSHTIEVVSFLEQIDNDKLKDRMPAPLVARNERLAGLAKRLACFGELMLILS